MLGLSTISKIYISCHSTDMRRSFDGLCGSVEQEFSLDPLSGHLFVFFNRRRTMVKMLLKKDLPNTVEELHNLYWDLFLRYQRLTEQYRILSKQRFGQSSEKSEKLDAIQLEMSGLFEALGDVEEKSNEESFNMEFSSLSAEMIGYYFLPFHHQYFLSYKYTNSLNNVIDINLLS